MWICFSNYPQILPYRGLGRRTHSWEFESKLREIGKGTSLVSKVHQQHLSCLSDPL